MDKESQKHVEDLGKLVADMQSLETILRFCLWVADSKGKPFPDYHELTQGDIVRKDPFTDYRNLRELIRDYNSNPLSAGLQIDETLVDVRDVIAHGRVYATAPSGPYQLLKFDEPQDDQVVVAFSASMTKEWFGKQITRFKDAVMKVHEANERQQSGGA